MTRILAIHAHPDDVEFLAGGTLALLAARGHAITIVTMTPGDCGSTEYPAEEIASIRRREAGTAAALIGATYRCAEFRDLSIFNDHESRRRVTEILREFQPELVLTSSPVDYLCDHETTSMLVRDACFAAPAPNYSTGALQPNPPLPAIPHLYFMDPAGGVDREGNPIVPDFVVNVESVFETKKRMLAEHRSQREWLMKHHGVDDYMILMEEWTRRAGSHAGIPLGEGFRRYKGHPYPQTPLLEELLGPGLALPVRRGLGAGT
ncbi:MAG: PIG-L family deacetylase [Bryobacterales bacterium]|nr:PIG-L family deacetylase [Bryobacteraceae bacterium]MDW8131924.1 PIG-L family deacetylase [Bryobacterales bacterium]